MDEVVGWVETARLYGISPIREPVPPSERFGSSDPMFQHPLVDAVITSDDERAKALMEQGASPEGPAETPGYPLRAALSRGDVAMVKILLAAKADPNQVGGKRNVQRMTPLMIVANISRIASLRGVLTINAGTVAADPARLAKLLIDAGASIEAKDADGSTALFYTLYQYNIDVAKLLLRSGADPNVKRAKDGSTPLIVAVRGLFTDLRSDHGPAAAGKRRRPQRAHCPDARRA